MTMDDDDDDDAEDDEEKEQASSGAGQRSTGELPPGVSHVDVTKQQETGDNDDSDDESSSSGDSDADSDECIGGDKVAVGSKDGDKQGHSNSH